jgi:hypothetical protein
VLRTTYCQPDTLQDGLVEHEVKGFVMADNNIARAGTEYSVIGVDMIGVYMDESDWEFVIRTLHQEGVRAMSADTRERAEFTADSIQDVLDGRR